MKTTLLIIGLIFSGFVFAQSVTLNWGTSFFPAWADGATTGNANNIGGSGVNCSVNIVKSGGVFSSPYGQTVPTVTSSSVTVPGSSKNIMIGLDYSASTQYTDVTFTFSSVVYSLSFRLADIDRLNNTSNSYFDRITISGKLGSLTLLPTISKYDATTDPNFFGISGNVAQVNTANGMAGNTASDATDQRGTINVNFDAGGIKSFTIRYDNQPGVASDPGVQFIAIGNISFNTSAPLPVKLTSFDGQNKNRVNELTWSSATESKMAYYAVEYSKNGNNFSEIGQVASHNSTTSSTYSFIDRNIVSNTSYYRLKMVDEDGSFTYSKIVIINANDGMETKVFPTVFNGSLNVHLSSTRSEAINCMLVDLSGKTVYSHAYNVREGVNEFSVAVPANLPKGEYFFLRSGNNKSIAVIKQ